jgi:hypothetical protein
MPLVSFASEILQTAVTEVSSEENHLIEMNSRNLITSRSGIFLFIHICPYSVTTKHFFIMGTLERTA